MKNIVLYKKGEQSWIRYIKKRIDHNLNFLALAQGPTGIGKSWSMLSVAYLIDKDFEARQIAFSFREVMEIINSDWFDKKDWQIILFDEAQTEMSNRKWQSLTNNLINLLLSTFRHRNIILLFTSPYSDFLDSQSMKLMHCIFDCKGWNKKTNKSLLRPKLLQYNSKMKKFYEHSLFIIKEGRTNKLISWKLNKPPKHLIKLYEKLKIKFTDQLNKKILSELDRAEGKKEEEEPEGTLNPNSMQPQIWEVAQKGYTNQKDLLNKLSKVMKIKIEQPNLSVNIKRMKKKGYDITKYKQIPRD